jgi:CheY-like chemotaxis protein
LFIFPFSRNVSHFSNFYHYATAGLYNSSYNWFFIEYWIKTGLHFYAGPFFYVIKVLKETKLTMNDGPVFIVDDDIDDSELLNDAWKELGFKNELKFFENGEDVLRYLKNETVVPFLIISEFNLPKMNGFELKRKLMDEEYTNYKSIPFVFLSTSVSQQQLQEAYQLCTNGFFIKEASFEALKQQLIDIVRYWLKSKVPS